MFGKSVIVDGREVWVWCTPDTPASELLQRASEQVRREEEDAARSNPNTVAYRKMVRAMWQS